MGLPVYADFRASCRIHHSWKLHGDKSSELSSHTCAMVRKIIEDSFVESYAREVEGGPAATQLLLEHQFDHIFFTCSEKVAQIVYQAAAKHLTHCILELGGKSQCIVTADANLELASKRIVWGKLLNDGQPCVAPYYPRIINEHNHQRQIDYLSNGKVVSGGASNRDKKYIAPTILDEIQWSDPVMKEEIYGPILPHIEFEDIEDVIQKIRQRA